jgi:hypothetical protein
MKSLIIILTIIFVWTSADAQSEEILRKFIANYEKIDTSIHQINGCGKCSIKHFDVTSFSIQIDGLDVFERQFRHQLNIDSITEEFLESDDQIMEEPIDTLNIFRKLMKRDSILCTRVASIGFPINGKKHYSPDSIFNLIVSSLDSVNTWNELPYHILDVHGGWPSDTKGDMYWFRHHQYHEIFAKAVAEHKVGDVFLVIIEDFNRAYVVRKTHNSKMFERVQFVLGSLPISK